MSNARHVKPPHLLLLILVVLPVAHLAVPLALLAPVPWNLAGILLVAVGIALNIFADALFKGYGSVRACRGPDVLVTGGPYGVSRNPMYLGFALILAGIAVLLGTLAPLLLAAGFVFLAERLFIRHEEAVLAERYGDEWIAYAARVRRWL